MLKYILVHDRARPMLTPNDRDHITDSFYTVYKCGNPHKEPQPADFQHFICTFVEPFGDEYSRMMSSYFRHPYLGPKNPSNRKREPKPSKDGRPMKVKLEKVKPSPASTFTVMVHRGEKDLTSEVKVSDVEPAFVTRRVSS